MFNFCKRNLTLIIFGLVLGFSGFVRFVSAPYSTGPDVAQFWAFAEVFRQHGIDFYRYAPAHQDIFPFYGWAYAYPPIWLILLGIALLFVPHSSAGAVTVDPAWRLAAKTPIILADLATGILLYWGLPGSKWFRLLFSALWLLNPAVWYNSAVFGQFDAIAAALLVASLFSLARGRIALAFIFGILAGLTKQTALLSLAMMTAAYAAQSGWTLTFKKLALMAAVALAISLPFLLTGNIGIYLKTLLLSGQKPDYVEPLIYSFNGLGSLATYWHEVHGWDTAGYFWFILPVMGACGLTILFFVYNRKLEILRAALVGILFFIAFYYRINYQYLVLMIALSLMVAASTPYRAERIMALVLALLPSVWLWIFDVSFWFVVYSPEYNGPAHILSRLGLNHPTYPDWVYLILALVITGLSLSYILCAFLLWPNRLKKLSSK